MKLGWCLPPLALLFLGGALWIQFRAREVSPEGLLASARTKLAQQPPDRLGARRDLDEALTLAHGIEDAPLRARLLDARAEVYQTIGLDSLALADCRARLEELGADIQPLERATELTLTTGALPQALEYANQLAELDPTRGQSWVGRARVALADQPLASLERMARAALPPSQANRALALAQRAAIFADDPSVRGAASEELLELLTRSDQRKLASEWVQEASEHLKAARMAFVASLQPGSTSEAIAGLQDLESRAGATLAAVELGRLALRIPNLQRPMVVLARTASALTALGREAEARELLASTKKRMPFALRLDALTSLPARDELSEWCALLEHLELWGELKNAAGELWLRAGTDVARAEQAQLFSARADLRTRKLGSAQRTLDGLAATTLVNPSATVRLWQARAELARLRGDAAPERFALHALTRAAPFDPEEPLRGELGRAYERLAELQHKGGDLFGAEVSLTHALRLSSPRAAEVEPVWHTVGQKSVANGRGISSPYALYQRAKWSLDQGHPDAALADARSLLGEYPGLGPALELASAASLFLHDNPRLIELSLELLERGWSPGAASARLRGVPEEFFLPQDRVRWLIADPRGSLEAVMRRLLERGDVHAAALAARGGPARYQPSELLPLLARTELAAGDVASAVETLALLPPESPLQASTSGLALRVALAGADPAQRELALAPAVARVIAAGPPRDPELVRALDELLLAGCTDALTPLLAWITQTPTPFLGEALLRAGVAAWRVPDARASREAFERAAALLDDGRADLAGLLASLVFEDPSAVRTAARAALAGPLAARDPVRAALLLLSGENDSELELAAARPPDGREPLLALVARGANLVELDDEAVSEILLTLAARQAPFHLWALSETAPNTNDAVLSLAAVRTRAEAWLTHGEPARARAELARLPSETCATNAELAWLDVRARRAQDLPPAEIEGAELAWLQAAGDGLEATPEVVVLRARAEALRGEREASHALLEEARAAHPEDGELALAQARLEDAPGRRTRALALFADALEKLPPARASGEVLAYLDLLRTARDEDEISEARWWSEVEALEAERPLDPAPVRELATRAFEVRPALEGAGGKALEQLDRFRSRTLERSLESLRAGEGLRWTRLLARFTPERAVAFAEEELRRDPSDPVLWRASAEALIAAGRARDALTRLEALERLAPELETTRLLALTSYELDRDEKRLAQRIANLTRLDPAAANDVLLQFYSALIEPPAKRQEGLTRALGLWEARATNGLEDLAHARVLALALLEAGRREPALATLREAWGLAPNALARDGVAALLFLAHQATLPPPRSEGRRAKEGGKDGAQDDAPGNVIKSEPQKPTTPATPKPGAKKGAKKKGGKKNAPAKNS